MTSLEHIPSRYIGKLVSTIPSGVSNPTVKLDPAPKLDNKGVPVFLTEVGVTITPLEGLAEEFYLTGGVEDTVHDTAEYQTARRGIANDAVGNPPEADESIAGNFKGHKTTAIVTIDPTWELRNFGKTINDQTETNTILLNNLIATSAQGGITYHRHNNLANNSEVFQNWETIGGIVIAPNTDLDPFGATTTADTITSGGLGVSWVGHNTKFISIPKNTTDFYMMSLYIKKTVSQVNDCLWQCPFYDTSTLIANVNVKVNTDTGVIEEAVTAGTNGWAGIEEEGDYWRVWILMRNNNGDRIKPRFWPADNSGLVDSKVIWGMDIRKDTALKAYEARAFQAIDVAPLNWTRDKILQTPYAGITKLSALPNKTVYYEVSGAGALLPTETLPLDVNRKFLGSVTSDDVQIIDIKNYIETTSI